jgi:DNA-binding transcriptional regulator GbsR (MarR family)
MTPPISADLPPIVHRFIEDAGTTSQSLGVGRVLGQIYAFLYFSQGPRSLADMQQVLGISKGSASTGVRQLEQWGAVRKVWIKGDRKDYYEANDWFGRILKNAVLDTVGTKLTAYSSLLDNVDSTMEEMNDGGINGDSQFIRERVEHLRKFQRKAQRVWNSPILKQFLK